MPDQPSLRDIIKERTKRCMEDPVFFMREYVKIQHPNKGTIPFDLYPFQEKTLKEFDLHRYLLILKSRQLGITTLIAAYALWLSIFNSDKNVLIISIKQEVSKEIITKVRFANEHLPSWLKVKETTNNHMSLRFENGSQIAATSSAKDAGRSKALSLLIVDEAAFIDEAESIWTSAYNTLSTGGKAIILSCVVGDTYIFTDKGIKQIKDFVKNNDKTECYNIDNYNILGFENLRNGNLFKNNGEVDTIKINTKFGFLEGSKIHKLWAYKSSDKKFDWYKLEDLTTNDYVSIQCGMNVWGNNDIIDFHPSVSNKIKNKIPYLNRITEEWSYLFGLYIAEGCCSKIFGNDNKFTGGSINITCGDKDITWIFDKLNLNYYTSDFIHYQISGKNLIELFECAGFDLSLKANNKIIPPKLLEMSKKNISYLLMGIFDGDGSSSGGNISLTSTSKQLIEQVRIVLNNFGILCSYVYHSKEQMNNFKSVKNKFNYDVHRLEIYGKNALKYFNLIGFSIRRKMDNKNILLKQNLNRNCSHDIIPNSLELVNILYENSGETTYSIKEKLGIFLNGIVNKSKTYKTKNISRNIVNIMYENYKNTLSDVLISYYDKSIAPNLYWVKIDDIQYGKNKTYDFSLPNDNSDFWCHSVIYNGFLGHQTPNGVGNWFHRMWVNGEKKKNDFHTLRLHWSMHPDRDQSWRDEQTKQLGAKGASQECDCDFLSSGTNVIDLQTLKWYEENPEMVHDRMEARRGEACWIFKQPEDGHSYIVSADVARGDGSDYSAAQVLDIDTLEQVAEFQDQLSCKDYGNELVELATKYNDALLIVEYTGIGAATLQQIIDRDYKNTFYSSLDLQIVEIHRQLSSRFNADERKLKPGFSTTLRTRPLIVSKIEAYFREKGVVIHSIRTINELKTFIWDNGKAQAAENYNDDLVIALGIGLWVRDTALRLRQEGILFTKSMLDRIKIIRNEDKTPIYTAKVQSTGQSQWQMRFGNKPGDVESLTWLLK